MKKLLVLSFLLLALAGRAQAQGVPPTLVVVRIIEYGKEATVIITRGEHQSEVSKFEASSYKAADQELNENFYRVLHQLYAEGYALQSVTRLGPSTSYNQQELIFTKNSR